jgi:hypothetical protein
MVPEAPPDLIVAQFGVLKKTAGKRNCLVFGVGRYARHLEQTGQLRKQDVGDSR